MVVRNWKTSNFMMLSIFLYLYREKMVVSQLRSQQEMDSGGCFCGLRLVIVSWPKGEVLVCCCLCCMLVFEL